MNLETIRRPLVLVVDDDADDRLLARIALEEAGFGIVEAEDGEEAVRAFGECHPDLVLADMTMPRMDGFELCQALRALPAGSQTPIAVMSGLDDTASISRAYAVGATTFINKPVKDAALIERLRHVLLGKETAEEPNYSRSQLVTAKRFASLGHWEWRTSRLHISCSAGVSAILGRGQKRDFVRFKEFLGLVHPADRRSVARAIRTGIRDQCDFSIEHRIIRSDGEERHVYQECEVTTGAAGTVTRVIGVAQDITERRLTEEKIRYLAYFDGTTGLPNRTSLNEIVTFTIENAGRYGRQFALLLLDIDHFRRINDSLGHNAGDALLRDVARRLRGCVRHSDRVFYGATPGANTVTRLGGDEFVVIISQMKNAEDVARTAHRIENTLARPFVIDDQQVAITGSIGISVFPTDGSDPEALLKNADAAMNHAKEHGRNRYQFFTESLNQQVMKKFSLETSLRKALDAGELILFYQPKIDIQRNMVVGAEALIRWNSPDLGMVPPADFIGIAEQTGLIVPIGDWVIAEACRQAVVWAEAGLPPLSMSVNLSAAQFRKPGLVKRIAAILCETGHDPKRLDLELTESLLMDDTDATVRTLRELTALGLTISIDDFGTGYSSLSYLKRFPIGCLKIDRSFVDDIARNADAAAIVNATIALAHTLRMTVVAEGVEKRRQLDFLRRAGCDQAQGFLFSKPCPADQAGEWIRDRSRVVAFPVRVAG